MSSDHTPTDAEKPANPTEVEHLEVIRTISKVSNPNYYEKDGLRTEGDGFDHSHYNTGSLTFIMTTLGCSFALCASQIVPLLYLTLGTLVAFELGAPQMQFWMFTASIIASGSLAPFVGPLADLFGRKVFFIAGIATAMVGAIICAATPTAAGFIAGQVLLGFGAVTEELLAIAVVAESVPTAKRPLYAAIILCSIIPWSPGTLYANWMANKSWRWIGCTLAIWHFITLTLLVIFYRPPPRVNSLGLSKRETAKRIDVVGGVLITAGLVLFLVGLNWGGQDYPWKSAHVLSFLIIGGILVIAFGFWEAFGAPHPLFPRRIIHVPRPFFCMMLVIFAAGINYVPLVVFWPIETISVYGSDRTHTGIYTLPIGTCILGGAILSALLIGIFKRHVTVIMTTFCVIQTVASACLTVLNPHDIHTAFPAIILALIGVGGVLVPNQVIITVITPDDLIASVTALTVGLRSQAQVIGLAIFYNRFVHDVTENAYKYIVPPMIEAGIYNVTLIETFVTSLTAEPYFQLAAQIPQLAKSPSFYKLVGEGVIQCFSHAFTLVYYITIAFGVVACIAAACMGDVSKYMDNHVAVVI